MLVTQGISKLRRIYYALINKMVLHKNIRWTFTSILIFSYIYSVQTVSFDIATYLIGFYLLQLLIGYFTPRGVVDDIDEEEGEGLYRMQ